MNGTSPLTPDDASSEPAVLKFTTKLKFIIAACSEMRHSGDLPFSMRLVTLLTFLMVFADAVSANPIVPSHPVYITSEKLGVTLTDDAAEIAGEFRFKSVGAIDTATESSPVNLSVPIWIPSDPAHADELTAKFLATFPKSQINSLDENNRAVWNSAIGVKLQVGSHEVRPTRVAIFDSSRKDQERIPKEWQRKGYFCVLVHLDFPPEWLKGNPLVCLQYRQGLVKSPRGAEFHYVPNFWHLPKGKTTSDLAAYSMTLCNRSATTFQLGSVSLRPGFSTVLPLVHHDSITVSTEAE